VRAFSFVQRNLKRQENEQRGPLAPLQAAPCRALAGELAARGRPLGPAAFEYEF